MPLASPRVAPDPAVIGATVAADIMTHDVATVRADSALRDAVQVMLARHISGLPVLGTNGDVVGMLTESDLLRRAEMGTEAKTRWLEAMFDPGRLAASFARAHGRRVSEVMTPGAVSVVETTPLQGVVTLMQDENVRRVLVMQGRRLVGIVARADLIRALGRLLQTQAASVPPAPTDAAIRHGFDAALADAAWTSKGITFTVTDGRVHLYGSVRDGRDRAAIQVTAENVPGVVSVEAHFTDPNQTDLIGLGPND